MSGIRVFFTTDLNGLRLLCLQPPTAPEIKSEVSQSPDENGQPPHSPSTRFNSIKLLSVSVSLKKRTASITSLPPSRLSGLFDSKTKTSPSNGTILFSHFNLTIMAILDLASDLVGRDLGMGGNGSHIIIPSIVGPLLAAVLVFNRLYWRIHLVHTLGIDDLCIGLSLVSNQIRPLSIRMCQRNKGLTLESFC